MKKRRTVHGPMGVVMAPLLGSCAADDIGDAGREGCDIILGHPIAVTSVTKAVDGRTSSNQFVQDEIVWLWANKNDGSSTEYIQAWKLKADGNGGFSSSTANNDKYWPSDGSKLDVYALHGNFINSPSISEGTTQWSNLSLTHTVKTDQSSDVNKRLSDLLYSQTSSVVAPNSGSVQLTFDHLLAKITVKLDLKNSMGITIEDFENASVSILGIKPEATFNSSSKEASTSGGTTINIKAGTIDKPTDLISEAYYAGSAIVPLQTIAANSSLIQFSLKDRTFIYKASENTAFQKGQEYTYTLTIRGKQITGTLSVSGFTSEEDKKILFKDKLDYLADLKNRSYLGSADAPHDLSCDYNGQMNTANCYVVTHPGYYKFPIVYGNAIKNEATNAIAYGSSTFVNHLGNQITDPYIYNNSGCTVNSASLVWQDAQYLIRNIALCDDNKYIKFEITKENIEQGNAVIAVKDGSGTIMWSWHIWVTNKNVYETYTYGDYKFMPIALGQRETEEGTTCTFYQWGRKDPFPGATASGQSLSSPFGTNITTDYKISITAPTTFMTGSDSDPYYYNWFSNDLKDLWNVGNSSYESSTSTSVKTIYDPSPVGFKVPPPAAFSSIELDKGNWNSTSGQEGFKGTVDGDFWRAFGYRVWNTGSSAYVGSDGYYWSCGPHLYDSRRNAWCLLFYSGGVYTQSTNGRAFGVSVRPVSE